MPGLWARSPVGGMREATHLAQENTQTMLSVITINIIKFQQPPLTGFMTLDNFSLSPSEPLFWLSNIVVSIKINNVYKAHNRSSTNVNYLHASISALEKIRQLPGTKLFSAIKEVFTLSLEYSLPFNLTGPSNASGHY